ncbi:MAG: phosphatidylinositol-specific phospholipase C domain-containing protein, partial [Clostridia bacterium]
MKRKILLIFLCIVMILSTLSLCACDDRWKEYTYDEFYCAWMKDIADDTLIKDIVIPGAHDAGTKGMIWMAETQDSSIMTQLKLGVRYFDLRVNKSKDNLVMFHSIIDGQNFLDVMSDITTFMETNTTELLILDFQHFKGESQADVSRLLTEKLDGKMVINNTNLPNLDFVDQLSLGECRGKCLVTFGDNYNSVNSNYIF